MTHTVAVEASPFALALDAAWRTIRRTIPLMGDQRPEVGKPDLTYQRSTRHFWVEGFWSGQLWLGYALTGEQLFFDAARSQRRYFAERLLLPETHDHDLGFLYTLSAVADYKLTGDSTAREMGLAAAEALAARFNPRGKFIRAWNEWSHDPLDNSGRIIIDGLENMALLFWAAREANRPDLAEIACAHAETSVRYLVRPDGSTYHTFVFDPATGAPLRGETNQGFADESCWSRGQAWAIHGLASIYSYCGEPLFLDTAQRLADYVLNQIDEHGVPLWDYCLTSDAPHYRDSSAGAITAAGLQLLADQFPQTSPQAEQYRSCAFHILITLISDYSTRDVPHAEGLLQHGVAHVPHGIIDTMLPYGDYFYLEALLRALGHRTFFW